MTSDDLPKISLNHDDLDNLGNTSGEISKNINEEKNIVAGILDNSDCLYSKNTDAMLAKLVMLEEDLSSTLHFYYQEYGKEFENIKSLGFYIGFAQPTKAFTVDNIAIKAIFSGLQSLALSEKESVLFQVYYQRFMQQTEENQVAMLWFFELIDAFVTPANRIANREFLEENPCLRILFKHNICTYTEWIARIFEDFDDDSQGMITLSHAIPKGADAPEIDIQRAEMFGAKMVANSKIHNDPVL